MNLHPARFRRNSRSPFDMWLQCENSCRQQIVSFLKVVNKQTHSFNIECIHFVKNQKFMRNSDVYNYYTTFKDSVHAVQHNTSLFKKNPSYMGNQFIKQLPTHISNCESKNQFRRLLKGYLIKHSFYRVDDFLSLWIFAVWHVSDVNYQLVLDITQILMNLGPPCLKIRVFLSARVN